MQIAELILGMALAVNTIYAVTACIVDAAEETQKILFPVREDEGDRACRQDVFDAWK